jgi:hypothetical protein
LMDSGAILLVFHIANTISRQLATSLDHPGRKISEHHRRDEPLASHAACSFLERSASTGRAHDNLNFLVRTEGNWQNCRQPCLSRAQRVAACGAVCMVKVSAVARQVSAQVYLVALPSSTAV